MGSEEVTTAVETYELAETPLQSPSLSLRGRRGFPFAAQTPSRPSSLAPGHRASTRGYNLHGAGGEKYFRSRRIKDTSLIEKPWVNIKDPKRKWHTIIPIICVVLGFAIVAFEVYEGWNKVVNFDYCMVYEDDFSSGVLNEDIWTKEVQVGGFG